VKKLFAAAGVAALFAAPALAEPEYLVIEMQIDVDAPAAEAWAQVNGFCDIGVWMDIECEITAGSGGVGTVRTFASGATEVIVGRTDLSYGYALPPIEGRVYNLYHGYLEARPLTETTSRLIYTVMYDVSMLDEEEREAGAERRRNAFTGALETMKAQIEAD
jgi:hypothetical protein